MQLECAVSSVKVISLKKRLCLSAALITKQKLIIIMNSLGRTEHEIETQLCFIY